MDPPSTAHAAPDVDQVAAAGVGPATAAAAPADGLHPPGSPAGVLQLEPDEPPHAAATETAHQQHKPLDGALEAIKLGSLRLANMIKREPRAQQQPGDAAAAAAADSTGPVEDQEIQQQQQQQQPGGGNEVVARLRVAAAGLGARAKEQGSRFYVASVRTAAATAEGIKRLALGEPVQALCRMELSVRPVPQLVLACCTALVSGGGLTTQQVFKHNPPQELVDRLAATAAGPLSLLPPGASPHAVAALLLQFLAGLPEPLLTFRLLPQWVAAGDHPGLMCRGLVLALPAANAGALRLLLQTCSFINEQSAVNEMDAQALAEVLAPLLAWKPAPKQPASSGSGPGPWQGIGRALSLAKGADAPAATAAAGGEQGGGGGSAGGEQHAPAEAEAAGGAHPAAAAAEQRVTPLDDAELEAITAVLEHMIANWATVFAPTGEQRQAPPPVA